MYKFLILIIVFMPLVLYGGGLPDSTVVTRENAIGLGIRLIDKDSRTSVTRLLSLEFPEKRRNCVARRVSSTLLNKNGDEVTSSSMDYQVGSSAPSILVHFRPDIFDMAIVIQYCCSDIEPSSCKSALIINSIKALET